MWYYKYIQGLWLNSLTEIYMNFQTLKSMIESIVKTYKCPICTSSVTEGDVNIIGAAWTTANIDISCSSCKKHSMVKIEVMWIDLTKATLNKNSLQELKSRFKDIQWDVEVLSHEESSDNPIQDENIVDLNKNLNIDKFTVEDLFKEED